jgi:hypothetical protein
MIRQTKFHRVRAARDHRDADPLTRIPLMVILFHRCAGYGEYQIAGIRCIAVDFRHITGLKQWGNVLQFLKRSSRTHLICDCERGAPATRNQTKCKL